MKYVPIIIWISWFLSEILLNRMSRSKNKDAKELDKNSLQLIWISIVLSITLGVLSDIYLNFPIAASAIVNYAGLMIILSGMVIRFIAIRTLGRFFTVDLSIHDRHELINTGLYKYIRHPSYSGSLLSFIGLGLSLNNWISLIIISIPVFLSMINRINIEEKLLQDSMGSTYDDYKKVTKRLIPFIY